MKADPICREKWRVQKKFARKAGYDPVRYLDLVHQSIELWAKKAGIKLKYADVSQLPVRTLFVKESPVEYRTKHVGNSRKVTRRRLQS